MLLLMHAEPVVSVERLDRMMGKRGWGPGELAYQSGVNYETLYKLRSGQRPRMSAELVGKLAHALGCSVDYLLGLTDNEAPYTENQVSFNVEDERSRTRLREFGELYTALSETDQEIWLDYTRRLKASETPRIIGNDDPADNKE